MTGPQQAILDAGSKLFPDNQAVYRALSDSQFVPYFQPLITLRTGQLAGFEVLARWKHPIEGMIPPDKFIPMAERDGWIGELTRQILKKALKAAAGLPGTFTIALNISPLQLRDLTLPEQIREIAMEADFPLSRLIIEITESALIDDMQLAVVVVAELKAMGCKLALDDFGTGYSSLHHLQSLPFDKLKVDRSFVSSMTSKRESRKIVSAVVGLGQSLGLTTVAEGIETEEQAEMMIWLGCELGQGYFYGRPIPHEQLAVWISNRKVPRLPDSARTRAANSRNSLDFSPSERLAQLQALYDSAPVGLGFVDLNLRFVSLNKKLAEMNGASVESHLGSLISEMIPEMYPFVVPYLMRALDGEAILNIEVRNPVTGETRLVNYQPALDEASEVVGIALAVSDIEVRKEDAVRLESSNVQYRSMIELNAQSWSPDRPERQGSEVRTSIPTTTNEPPLKLHEIIALNLVAQCSSPRGMTLGEIAREMHKVGMVQAASLAVNSLRRRKFIVRQQISCTSGGGPAGETGLLLTPFGQQWLDKNPQPVASSKFHIDPSTEPRSLIDFLTTLRFRN